MVKGLGPGRSKVSFDLSDCTAIVPKSMGYTHRIFALKRSSSREQSPKILSFFAAATGRTQSLERLFYRQLR